MDFSVEGPFKLKRIGKKKLLNKESLIKLIDQLSADGCEDLITACGCYVFALQAAKGFKPWYVGQANKSTLVKEALNASNLEKYNNALNKGFGTPVLFLIPLLTKVNAKYSKPATSATGKKSINFLEEWLIAAGLQKNAKLMNQKKTFFLKNLHVTGIFNASKGEATLASRTLSKTLGI